MKRAVFLDFDGTITVEETFVKLLKHFAPELSAELLPEMYALRLTLRDGVRQLLESIPSSRYQEMLEFSRGAEIRPGFAELLDFLDARNVPAVVVSGGVTDVVRTILGPLALRLQGLHAVDLDRSGPHLRALSDSEAGTELVSKVDVMDRYPAEERVAVGDSVTDLNLAQAAEVVFARGRLCDYLDERKVFYRRWDDFFSIRNALEQRWGA